MMMIVTCFWRLDQNFFDAAAAAAAAATES
jgi:hypothetical protein